MNAAMLTDLAARLRLAGWHEPLPGAEPLARCEVLTLETWYSPPKQCSFRASREVDGRKVCTTHWRIGEGRKGSHAFLRLEPVRLRFVDPDPKKKARRKK